MTTPAPAAPVTNIFAPSFQPVGAIDALESWFGPLCCDHAENLYHFEDGVWHPNAENVIRHRLVTLIGNAYKQSYASVVLEILRARPALLTDEPQDQYLNLPNGLLDWRTGELLPHNPAVPSRIQIPVVWDENATCPEIERWMSQVFPADCREMVEEVIGLCLLDDNPFHKAILLHGTGRNGKGTFIRLLSRLLGRDNTCAVNPQTLDTDRFAAAELRGKLANLAGDVDARRFVGTEVFKQVTGGDRIKAERKYGQPFHFTCRALMIAAFNELPSTSDLSEGYFARWVIVPMTGYFPAGRADSGVEDRIGTEAELQGLLVLGVRGLRRLMERGAFLKPQSVLAAEDSYQEEADPCLQWLREECQQLVALERLSRADVYARFTSFCLRNGIKPWSSRKLYSKLDGAGAECYMHIYPWRSSQTRGFVFTRAMPDGDLT